MKKSNILAVAMSVSLIFGGGILLLEPSNIAYAGETQCNQEKIEELKGQIKTLEEKIKGINTQIEEKENEKVKDEEGMQLTQDFKDANQTYKNYLDANKNVAAEVMAAQEKEVEEYNKAKALSDECTALYKEWQDDKENKEKEDKYNNKFAEYQAQNAKYMDARAKNQQTREKNQAFIDECERLWGEVSKKRNEFI